MFIDTIIFEIDIFDAEIEEFYKNEANSEEDQDETCCKDRTEASRTFCGCWG